MYIIFWQPLHDGKDTIQHYIELTFIWIQQKFKGGKFFTLYSQLPVTQTFYNLNFPLTQSNFNFLSDRFLHNFTPYNSNSR